MAGHGVPTDDGYCDLGPLAHLRFSYPGAGSFHREATPCWRSRSAVARSVAVGRAPGLLRRTHEKDTKPCGSQHLPSGISLFPARMLTGLRKMS
jgi:hypothetical protein